jgi:hypothetical protein
MEWISNAMKEGAQVSFGSEARNWDMRVGLKPKGCNFLWTFLEGWEKCKGNLVFMGRQSKCL